MFFITGLTPRDGGGDLEKLEINVYSARAVSQAAVLVVVGGNAALQLTLVVWWKVGK